MTHTVLTGLTDAPLGPGLAKVPTGVPGWTRSPAAGCPTAG